MTYVYVCEHCKIKFEKKHSMNETPKFTCNECGGDLKRIITGGSTTIFKGSGWTRAGRKDKNYNRSRKMEHFQENPSDDPYAGYRNWNEENI